MKQSNRSSWYWLMNLLMEFYEKKELHSQGEGRGSHLKITSICVRINNLTWLRGNCLSLWKYPGIWDSKAVCILAGWRRAGKEEKHMYFHREGLATLSWFASPVGIQWTCRLTDWHVILKGQFKKAFRPLGGRSDQASEAKRSKGICSKLWRKALAGFLEDMIIDIPLHAASGPR